MPVTVLASFATPADRLAAADWPRIAADLDERGAALLPGLLDRDACRALAASWDDASLFRSRVVAETGG